VNDEEREYLNETIRNLNNQLVDALRERDEARMRMGRILNEIDCRVQHGADSNGHLEAVLSLFKENTK